MDNDTALSAATTTSSSGRTISNRSSSGNRTGNGNSSSAGDDDIPIKKKRPKVATTSSHIFTRISFSELPLDARLATHLEKSILDGGMGLLSSTRVQRYHVSYLTLFYSMLSTQTIPTTHRPLIMLYSKQTYYLTRSTLSQSPSTNYCLPTATYLLSTPIHSHTHQYSHTTHHPHTLITTHYQCNCSLVN
jgi:hypothetical protein